MVTEIQSVQQGSVTSWRSTTQSPALDSELHLRDNSQFLRGEASAQNYIGYVPNNFPAIEVTEDQENASNDEIEQVDAPNDESENLQVPIFSNERRADSITSTDASNLSEHRGSINSLSTRSDSVLAHVESPSSQISNRDSADSLREGSFLNSEFAFF